MTEREVIEKLNVFKNALIKKNDEIKGLKEENEKIASSLKELQESNNSISQDEFNSLKQEKEQLTAQINVLKEAAQDNAATQSQSQSKISSLENDIKNKDGEITALNATIEDQTSKNKSLQEQVNSLSKELIAAQDAIESKQKDAENEIAATQRRVEEKFFDKNKTIIKLEDNVKALNEEIAGLNEKNNQLKLDIDLVIKQKDDEISKKDEEISELQKAVDKEIQDKSTQLSAAVNNFRGLLNVKDKELESVKAKLAEAEDTINELLEVIKLKDNDIKTINEKLNEQGFIQHSKVSEENAEEMKFVLEKIKSYNEKKEEAAIAEEKAEEIEDDEPVSPADKELIYYRFGHTHASIKDQLIRFINELYNGIDDTHSPYELNNINSAAARSKISNKTKNVFVKRLYEMTNSGKPLIYNKDNILYSDFTRDFLIDFTTAIVR